MQGKFEDWIKLGFYISFRDHLLKISKKNHLNLVVIVVNIHVLDF